MKRLILAICISLVPTLILAQRGRGVETPSRYGLGGIAMTVFFIVIYQLYKLIDRRIEKSDKLSEIKQEQKKKKTTRNYPSEVQEKEKRINGGVYEEGEVKLFGTKAYLNEKEFEETSNKLNIFGGTLTSDTFKYWAKSYLINGVLNIRGKDNVIFRKKIYKEGTLVYEETYSKGELRDGRFTSNFPNGQLQSESFYKNGMEYGTSRFWYENGQLEYESYYKNGLMHGTDKNWHENGQLKSESCYKDGLEHGTFKSWHENGQLESEYNCENGMWNF